MPRVALVTGSGSRRVGNAVASMLAAIGATNIRIRATQFRDQSRWLLPQDEFPPSRYLAAELEEGHAAHA